MNQPAGLAAIFDEIRPRLYRLLAARTGDPALADDLLQDLWIKIRTLEPGPVGNPEAYIFRMAQNLATDHARSRIQRALREEHWVEASTTVSDGIARDDLPDAERTLIAREELSRVRQALADMPTRAAEVFQLHRVEGESHSEIAARLGISRSAVEKSMAIALKHLFRLLSG